MENNLNNIVITDKEIELLKQIKRERKNQDKRMTNLPIYIVEEKKKIAVHPDCTQYDEKELLIAELDNNSFSFKDIKNGKLRNTELSRYTVSNLEEEESIEDMKEYLSENYYECELMKILYIYKTTAIFLCLKEAERYLEYQNHNLTEPRIMVKNVGYNNEGLLAKLLEELDRK